MFPGSEVESAAACGSVTAMSDGADVQVINPLILSCKSLPTQRRARRLLGDSVSKWHSSWRQAVPGSWALLGVGEVSNSQIME